MEKKGWISKEKVDQENMVDNVKDKTENIKDKAESVKDKEDIEETVDEKKETEGAEENRKDRYKVELSKAVDKSYFEDAVFIGDSRTEAFAMFSGLTSSTFYAYKGFSIEKVLDKPVVNTSAGAITVIDALKNETFSKVYIMFGLNELGWQYPEIFIKKYEEVIQKILEMHGDAIVYVQSILPVTTEHSQISEFETNDRINIYNDMIEDMCKRLGRENKVYFLDVREDMQDEDGTLPKDSAFDGVHLKKEYVLVWLEYLKTHTVN